MINRYLVSALLAFLLSVAEPVVSLAQPGGAVQSIAPMTRDLGSIRALSAQVTGTVVSSDQSGFNVSRVICLYNQTTTVALSSTTFAIQNKDGASGVYYNLIQSAAVASGVQTSTIIAAGTGVVGNNLMTSTQLPIARTWRVSATVGGASTSTVTGTIGCSVQ